MNDKQLEVAARRLCELRGVDPDSTVQHGAEPGPSGVAPDLLLESCAWQLAVAQIKDAYNKQLAIEAGLGNEEETKPEVTLTTTNNEREEALKKRVEELEAETRRLAEKLRNANPRV